MDCFIGTILPWPLQWAPVDFNNCDGTKIAVNANQALFSLISNVYGGDGQNNFALPDLRGRVPVGQDINAVNGTQYLPGQTGGAKQVAVSLTINNLPAHTHSAAIGGTAQGTLPTLTGSLGVSAAANSGVTNTPSAANVPAVVPPIVISGTNSKAVNAYGVTDNATKWPVAINGSGGPINLALSGAAITVGVTGASQPFAVDVRQPYQVINYIIALIGIYPMRP